jgi:hypothetical protein
MDSETALHRRGNVARLLERANLSTRIRVPAFGHLSPSPCRGAGGEVNNLAVPINVAYALDAGAKSFRLLLG